MIAPFRLDDIFNQSGSLVFTETGGLPLFCADVEASLDGDYLNGIGLPKNGARVQAHDCRPEQLNQKWNLSGSFKRDAGACITLTNRSILGAPVTTSACNGAIAQEWDYYWNP